MEHKSITMEDFLLKGEETLKIIQEQARVATKATKFNQWLFAGILSIMLIIIVDTRIEVVKKVDASEVQQEYVTKVDALNIHKLEESYTKELINRALKGDTTIKDTNYNWIVESICDPNHRGN